MEKDRQQILEELIHRELSRLSEQPAPKTLIPRILAEIKAREQRHWWQRSWNDWPFVIKVLSIPILLGGAGLALFCFSLLWNLLLSRTDFGLIAQQMEAFSVVWDCISALGNAVLVLGKSIEQQWLTVALVLATSMYLACVGLGTLCYRVVFHIR